MSIISNIFLIEEFPFQNSPRSGSLQSTFTLPSTPSSFGSPPFAFGRQEVSSTQSTLLTYPLKNANESESTFQFRVSTSMKLFKEERYLEAIMKYTSAIQLRDGVSEYISNRAMCYFNMEYFEIALSDFQKAFSITPNSVRYQYWIALTWSKIGNHKVSLDILTKIKSIHTEKILWTGGISKTKRENNGRKCKW